MSIASEALKTAYSRSLTQIESVTGVTYTQDVKTPIFTLKTNPADREGDSATDLFGANLAGIQSADKQLNDAGKKLQGLHVPIESNVQEPELLGVREKHELSAGDKIKIIKIPNKDPDTTKSSALIEDQEYVIATVPSTGTFTLQGDIDTSKEDGVNPDEPSHYRTIEYKPTVRDGEDVEEIKIKLKGSLAQIFTGDNEFDLLNIKDSWYQAKLGNNPIFTAIAQKAAIASALLSVNIQFVQTGLDLSKVLLLAALNPQLLLLIAIADEIDKFVQDFKSTGIYFLPVMATSFAVEIPKDKDGNDIKLVSSGATMVVAYDAAIAAGIEYQGRTVVGKAEIAADINHTRDEFEKWARSSDGLNLGPALPDQIVSFRNQLQSGNFAIPQGATSAEVVGAIKTDMMIKSTAGGFGQVPRMTPSQVIATMIAAMNEFPRDPKAPNFSDSADVAAVIIIAGFPDFDKSIADVVELFELLGDWFGTDSPAMEAINVIKDIVNEADNFFKFNINAETEIKVTKVSGIRGGTGDEEELISTAIGGTQSPVESGTVEGAVSQVVQKGSAFSNFLYENTFASPFTGDPILGTKDPELVKIAARYDAKSSRKKLKDAYGGVAPWKERGFYNFKDEFEVGDFIAGPKDVTGNKALGYVSSVKKTDFESGQTDDLYQTQTLVIQCINSLSKDAFDQFSAGSWIQQVAYVLTDEGVEIDRNSAELKKIAPDISYKHLSQLKGSEAKKVSKVTRTSGNYLLDEYDTYDVSEKHGLSRGAALGRYRTHNVVAGKLENPIVVKPFATPPNFQRFGIGEILPPMEELFNYIERFTKALRSLAAGTLETIDRIYVFLNEMLDELKKFVAIIQKILKLFTNGLPDTGIYSLIIPSTSGGNNTIIKSLESAAGRPPNSLDFSMGLMFMGGAAAIDPLLLLLGASGGTASSRVE